MKQEEIDKRIKELQKDPKYTFKLTEDVIDIVYRTAIDDIKNNTTEKIKDNKDDIIIDSSKDLNTKFGNKKSSKFGSKRKEEKSSIDDLAVEPAVCRNTEFNIKHKVYVEIMNYIDTHNDLLDVYIYVKEKAKEPNPYEVSKHWPAP